MLDKIIGYYKMKGVDLPQNEIEILSKLIHTKTINKKDFLYKKGESKISSAYILKGCLRVYIEDSKNIEYNRFFGFEDSWIGEYHQILNNLPSKTSVQAVEKTEIIEISKDAFQILLKDCPVFSQANLKLSLSRYAKLLEREELKKTLTIEELYADLQKNLPQIIERVPLYHIASYLGVKPESLSRVKKKLKESEV